MEEKKIEAVKRWLEAIMPAVVETLVASLTEEVLHDMGKEEGIHGPIAVNLEEFRAPITAINFYTIVVEDGMMLATTADVNGKNIFPGISFDMFFPITDFATSIVNEEHVQQLVDLVFGQFKKTVE